MDVAQLREALFRKEFSIEQLVMFYISRTYDLGRRLNLSTVERFKEAIDEAKLKDFILNQALDNGTSSSLPPLFGIPISVKDNVRSKY